MKKILLIIILIVAIFQMVVLATAIDIGSAAVDGDDYWGGNTWINGANPANESGKITTIEIYAQNGYPLSNCSVGTCYLESGTNFTTRDYEKVSNGAGEGVVTAGSKQTFTVDLDVETGDYLCIQFDYDDGGRIESTTSGTSWRIVTPLQLPTDDATFTESSNTTLSLYGTGATEEAAEDNAIFFGMPF